MMARISPVASTLRHLPAAVIMTFLLTFNTIAAEKNNATDASPDRGGELHIALAHAPRHLNPAIQSGIYTGMPGAKTMGLHSWQTAW